MPRRKVIVMRIATPRLPLPVAMLLATCIAGVSTAHAALSQGELVELLKTLDTRQRVQGDWQSNNYIEQKEKDKVSVAYEAVVLRRSQDQRFVIMFTQPKAAAGQGYLRADGNLWFYDPAVGKWERRTERERIGGTGSRRSDFDQSRLAEEYDPQDSGVEAVGAHKARVLTLHAKQGVDVPFPLLKLWVDVESKNVLKRQEFALSGKLARTLYYPKWKKVEGTAKAETWYAEEVRIFDEVDKGSSTLILVRSVDLQPLPSNMFTKAWLESKSR
jgi:hypothetical protein